MGRQKEPFNSLSLSLSVNGERRKETRRERKRENRGKRHSREHISLMITKPKEGRLPFGFL